MSFSATTGIPTILTIGDAASFGVSDPDHPASEWAAILYFKDESGAIKNFNRASVTGDVHNFVLTNTNTGTLIAGRNLVSIAFSDGTHRQVSEWTECLILSDPTTAATPTFAEAQVTLLQSLLASVNASGATTVNFNGQSFTRANIAELQNQLIQWQATVYQEKEQAKADRGLATIGNRIPVRFAQ